MRFLKNILKRLLVACDAKQEELPPQYGMLCNTDSTKFVATMPGGTRLYKNDVGYVPYSNYKNALKHAWRQYEFKPSGVPDRTSWQKCN